MNISTLSKSTYFYTLNKVNFDEKNAKIINEIANIYTANKSRYGYRRITLELKNRGLVVNHKKVKRIMSSLGLFGAKAKAKYKSYKGDMNGTCKNALIIKKIDKEKHKTFYDRNFDTTTPYEKLGTDVTVFIMPFGKLYLSPIIDFHTREILAYNLSKSPDFRQIKKMFIELKDKHGDKVRGAILHSDQGWQYQMQQYQQKVKKLAMFQSMSRKGNCLDNSPN